MQVSIKHVHLIKTWKCLNPPLRHFYPVADRRTAAAGPAHGSINIW